MRDTLLEKLVHWAIGGLATVLSSWVVTWHDPFYHGGWLADHLGWTLLPIVVAFIAVALCLSKIGFWVTFILAVLAATAFGILYRNEGYQHGAWPVVTWILHLVVLALLVGIVAGLASRLTFRVTH